MRTWLLRGRFHAHSVGGRIEGGYRIAALIPVDVTPYAAAQVQRFSTLAYGEAAVSGSTQFALNYAAQSSTATRLELGTWLDKRFALSSGSALALRGRVAWAHDHSSSGALNAGFQTLPGASFTVNGARPPSDLALLTGGAELILPNRVSFGFKLDSELASRAQSYAGTGTVRYAW